MGADRRARGLRGRVDGAAAVCVDGGVGRHPGDLRDDRLRARIDWPGYAPHRARWKARRRRCSPSSGRGTRGCDDDNGPSPNCRCLDDDERHGTDHGSPGSAADQPVSGGGHHTATATMAHQPTTSGGRRPARREERTIRHLAPGRSAVTAPDTPTSGGLAADRSIRSGATGVVAVAGEALVDLVPAPVGGYFEIAPGGSPANVALGLARLGVPARLLARIADDILGKRIRAHLTPHGVQLDHAVAATEQTSLAMVSLDETGRPPTTSGSPAPPTGSGRPRRSRARSTRAPPGRSWRCIPDRWR